MVTEYLAREHHGLNPVIETDNDLAEWIQLTASMAVGCEASEIKVTVSNDDIVLEAGPEIITDLRYSWMP